MAKRAKTNGEATARQNVLYYGDNIDVLRRYITADSVDLVYLDPPFKSNADYNILFAEKDGTRAAAQIKAFGDTWRWDVAAARSYEDFVLEGPRKASRALQAFRTLVGESDMLAYLAMMAPRLTELHRVLKPTGSLYLHCDPTARHYLKLFLDSIFGAENFRNEIIWKRSHGHNSAKRFGPNHDVILFYGKTPNTSWNGVYQAYDPAYTKKHYRHVDAKGRRYKHENPSGAGLRYGETGNPWRGIDPSAKGRHWAKTPSEMDRLDALGLIHWPEKPGAWPYIKTYLNEEKGVPAQDVWSDIDPINMMAAERLGYPTQKPELLLERIVAASSSPGDVVLDPFCGCGTAISVAQRLGRRWVGVDITHLAIALIKGRLLDGSGEGIAKTYSVVGEPASVYDAANLVQYDRYQFQYWALGLVGARPADSERKKGADGGVDGRLFFHDDTSSARTKQVVFSVKSGRVDVSQIRDLRGVMEREDAEMAAFITMEDPTGPMRAEAIGAGSYQSPWGTRHPRIQIHTIAELLNGRELDMPPSRDLRTYRKSPRTSSPREAAPHLPFGDDKT